MLNKIPVNCVFQNLSHNYRCSRCSRCKEISCIIQKLSS